jgi:hypothetical protein
LLWFSQSILRATFATLFTVNHALPLPWFCSAFCLDLLSLFVAAEEAAWRAALHLAQHAYVTAPANLSLLSVPM